jgi:hypothetical protein
LILTKALTQAAITKDGERRIVDMSENLLDVTFSCRPSGEGSAENFTRNCWALPTP